MAYKLFADQEDPAHGNSRAALAIVRNLILALAGSGALRPDVLDAALRDAEAEVTAIPGNNGTNREPSELILAIRQMVADASRHG